MNRIHIISGTVIATISLRVTAATMPDQPALAHEGYYYYGYHNNHHHGGSAAAAQQLAIAQLQQQPQVAVQQLPAASDD